MTTTTFVMLDLGAIILFVYRSWRLNISEVTFLCNDKPSTDDRIYLIFGPQEPLYGFIVPSTKDGLLEMIANCPSLERGCAKYSVGANVIVAIAINPNARSMESEVKMGVSLAARKYPILFTTTRLKAIIKLTEDDRKI